MKIFHCTHCRNLVFFENVRCVQCERALAYLPERQEMAALETAGDGLWQAGEDEAKYRLCRNYAQENVCNWVVPAADPNPFCRSCRLTAVIPDLSRPGHRAAWCRLETAKRRLLYTLFSLELPVVARAESPAEGLSFQFLADPEGPGAAPVLTGHSNGIITVSVAEADDAEREKRRTSLHEGYRTLLGHLRHEVGHYYWDRLIRNTPWLASFRAHFGNEQADYDQALRRHYQDGPPADWQDRFVSAYASVHPWEDWAETWAHYLHITDTLETALECGLVLRPKRADEPALRAFGTAVGRRARTFDQVISGWFPLSYVLNNLNRDMGLADAYPFVLADAAVDKLRFVHDVVVAADATGAAQAG